METTHDVEILVPKIGPDGPVPGETVAVYVQVTGEPEDGGQEVGGGGLERGFSNVLDGIQGVVGQVVDAVRAVAPEKFAVEMGFELKSGTGGLAAMLVQAGGTASIKVTMEWTKNAPASLEG